MSKPLRLSDLTPGRQALVRLCETINFGSIEDLAVRNCEPTFDPAPVMLRDVKLDSDEGPRPELALEDFIVSNEIIRLMGYLDKMKFGVVRRVEVRAGIPRRILLASRVSSAAATKLAGGASEENVSAVPPTSAPEWLA